MSSYSPAQDSVVSVPAEQAAPGRRAPRTWQSYLSIAAMIIPALLLLGTGLLAGSPPAENDIEQGVTIGNVSVEGSGWTTIERDLQASFDEFLETPVTLIIGGNEVNATPAELGFSYDMEATHQRALGIGRGDLFTATGERLIAHTRGYDIDPVVQVDQENFLSFIEPLAREVVVAPVNASFMFDGEAVAINEAENGVGVDPTAALRELYASAVAVDAGQTVEVPTTVVEPEVTTSELEAILGEATRLSADPLRLTDGENAWQLTSEDLVALITYGDSEIGIDRTMLEARIAALDPIVHQLARNAEIIREEDGSFSLQPEQLERTLDVDASVDATVEAILDGDESVALVVEESEPPATKERILPLYRKLTEMTARGVTLSWSEGAIEIDRKAFSDSIVWNTLTGDVWFDHERLAQAIQPIAEVATRPPTNLRWLDGQVIAREDASPGLRADAHASIPAVIDAAVYGHEYAELVVHQDTTVDPASLGIEIKHVLGSSTTYYGDSSSNRKTNVEVAVRALNGAMVPPHSTFSFNEAIGGTATLEDGYMMGYGIVAEGGRVLTVPSVAGGICQVATTAFQAAFWAGMPMVERSWHLYWIPRYGDGSGGLTGLDATVDPDYDLDFKFSNPTDDWLAISAFADGQNLTIEVWGIHRGWTVDVGDPEITNVVEASSEVIRRQDDSVAPGSEVWVEHAQDGFNASIHRVVKDAEGNVIDDTVFHSNYLPASNVVLVGPS